MVMRRLKFFLLLILLSVPLRGQAAELQAIPDRTRIGLEEGFTLELRATGSVEGDPDLSVLEEDFELLGRSQASQVRIINGSITRSTTWRLSLLARSAGSKLIPPLCIDTDCSAPVAVAVLADEPQQNAAGSGADLLLEVSAEPESLPVQAQLLYSVRLLTRLNFLQASLTDPQPSGVEAVVQKLGEDRQYETRRGGVRYQVIERQYAIFPQQQGRLTIPALQFDAQVSDSGRSSYDPFNRQVRQLRKRSEELSVIVLPVTETNGRPWLPATEVRLEDDWQNQPPHLTVGEPVTRTLTLRAAGLPAAQLPQFDLQIPEGVKSYPDQPHREDRVGATGITGVLQQKLALVPTRPGPLRLPEIIIDWWNLTAERWQQTRLPEIEVEVLPSAGPPQVITPPPQSVAPVVAEPPAIFPLAPAPVNPGFWPWLSLALALGWLLTLMVTLIRYRLKKVAPVTEESQPNLKAARRELLQVIEQGEPTQVRVALLTWGQALYPEPRPENLEQLAALCGSPLAKGLEKLNRSLYSRSSGSWDGKELLAAVEQAERQRADKKQSGLPPFYPEQ